MKTHAAAGSDVVVIGGGPAGLAAALVLARAGRSVTVCDGGEYRNATARAMHGFPSRDGTPPSEFRSRARAELAEYEQVESCHAAAIAAAGEQDRFELTLADGRRLGASRLLLATGVRDQLPRLPGIEEAWGRTVFTCPYCDGWEVRNQPLAAMLVGDAGLEYVRTLRNWSRELVVCSAGGLPAGEAERRWLAERRIEARHEAVRAVETGPTSVRLVFAEGPPIERRAVFVSPDPRPRTDLSRQLGCRHDDAGFVETDRGGRTSVAGVFAAGDVARGEDPHHALAAAADGATAAMVLMAELLDAEDPVLPD